MVIKHFSHEHPLIPYEVKDDDNVYCSICAEEMLPSLPAYACEDDSFCLHKHCYELPREIQHPSHPKHPLSLLPEPPSFLFSCDACHGYLSSFVYSCTACDFAIHVRCSSMEDSVERSDHPHPLHLVFSLPSESKEDAEEEEEEILYRCRVCDWYVLEGRWAYLCKECSYVTHLECVDAEADLFGKEEEEEEVVKEEEEEERNIHGSEKEEEEREGSENSVEEEEEEETQYSIGREEEEEEEEEEEDTEEVSLDVIARNQERIIVQQMMLNNQQMRMQRQMQRQMMMNTTRLFHFGL